MSRDLLAGSSPSILGDSEEARECRALADLGITETRDARSLVIPEESGRVLSKFGLTVKDQRFAENLASGAFANLLQAAEDAGLPISTYNGAYASSRRPKIRAAVKALLEDGEKSWMISKEEIIQYLTKVVVSPLDAITRESDMAESITEGKFGTTLKVYSKQKAIDQLCRLMGWNAPEELTVNADIQIAELIGRIRTGKIIDVGDTSIRLGSQ